MSTNEADTPESPSSDVPPDDSSNFGEIDLELARVVEELTHRLQNGGESAILEIERDHPELASRVRHLIPAIRGLAHLGHALNVENPLLGSENQDGGGRRIFGDFQIVREIGRGGMGVVYEAEQMPLGRRVALKVLLSAVALDPKALQRFQLEAQVAGLLQHPRIVPVHAVGTVGEVPFFAMRLVEGGSLADLIAEMRGLVEAEPGEGSPSEEKRRIGILANGMLSGRFGPSRSESKSDRLHKQDASERGLSGSNSTSIQTKSYIRTVARLGIQAAEALGYAHDQGITHRDIKPANLLLDHHGDVWVADFGMADVQGNAGLTVTGDMPGTLRYMSPEQSMGKRALVDRRTDIYSLGVTLYELSTLQPAIQGTERQEIFRRIAEDEPAPIRKFNSAVPVDLATIIAKAMSKEPAQRYETAGHFADDLERFLEGRPIAARPLGPFARGWRWCRRKPLQAALTASLVLTFLGGFSGITWSWREAVRQKSNLLIAEKEARRQTAIAEAINRFLVDRLLGQASPENNPDANRVTLLEVLDRAAVEVGSSFQGQPEVEASIRLAIGDAYHGLGENAKSLVHFITALRLLENQKGSSKALVIQARSDLGHALTHLNRLDNAEPLLRKAYEESQAYLDPSDSTALAVLENLADFETTKNRLDEAEAHFRQLIANAGKAKPVDQDAILTAKNNLAIALTKLGHLKEAEEINRQLIQDSKKYRGDKHPGTLSAINNLATIFEKQRNYIEAERLFRQVAELNEKVLGPHHPGKFACWYNLAHVLSNLGRFDESEALFRKNIAEQRLTLSSDHPTLLYTTSRLGALLRKRGRLDEAEALLAPCLEAQRKNLGPNHADTLKTVERLEGVRNDRDLAAKAGETPVSPVVRH